MIDRSLKLPPGIGKVWKEKRIGQYFTDHEEAQLIAEIEAIGAFFSDANFDGVQGVELIKLTGEEPAPGKCRACGRSYEQD
ncbi:MAG: hypothetical protein AAF968_03410 [Pseudomonadota bacterium]